MGVVGSGTASAARRIHYANFVMSVPGQFCKGGNEGSEKVGGSESTQCV